MASNKSIKINSTAQDWFNHIAGMGISDHTISIILQFDTKLDTELLEQSIQLSITADPVLGSSFIPAEPVPYFENKPDNMASDFFSVIETENYEEELREFLACKMDDSKMITITLFRSLGSDTLCIKLNHTCGDAGALKQYLLFLSDIYSNLATDSLYIPPSKTVEERSAKLIFDALALENPFSMLNAESGRIIPNWSFLFEKSEGSVDYHQSVKIFSLSEYKNLYAFAKSNGFTINDLILTAYYRQLSKSSYLLEKADRTVDVTVDLRRYLSPEINLPTCNLSAMVTLQIPDCSDDSFIESARKIKKVFTEKLNEKADLINTIGCEYLGTMGYKSMLGYVMDGWGKGKQYNICSPMLSNIGIISREPIHFGNIPAKNIYVVPPAFYAPAFMLAASFYNNILTIMSCYYSSEVNKEKVENFLQSVYLELVDL